MEEHIEEGIRLDENYQKLQAKVTENLIESLSTGYSLNEKKIIFV